MGWLVDLRGEALARHTIVQQNAGVHPSMPEETR